MRSGKWGYTAIETLEARQLLAVTIDPLGDVTYPGGKSIFVPVNGASTGSPQLSYSVSTSDARISARILQNVTFVDMNISIGGVAQAPIRLALFGDIAPNTVSRFLQLVNSGFYNGLTFHRIIPGFMAQGGDPLGTGSGGSGTSIDDEFNADAIFSTTGLLAMANSNNGSTCDTNDSQFFITATKTRWLDFRHTIFGQMISGQGTFNAMMAAGTSAGTPTQTVVITSAAVVQDPDTTVLLVKGPTGLPGQVTVSATNGPERTASTFNVLGVDDSANNDPPFLGPVSDVNMMTWQKLTVIPTAIDLEHDAPYFNYAVDTSSTNDIAVTRSGSKFIITAKNGFSGTAYVLFGVYQPTTKTWDSQWMPVHVTNPFNTDSTARTFYVSGTDGNDKVSLSVSAGMLVAKFGSYTQRVPLSSIDKIVADLKGGNDSLTAGVGVPPVVAYGGAGNDTIRGGSSADSLYGEDGNDSLRGNGGDDRIEGGSGDDRISGDAGNDMLSGGDGVDLIQGGNDNDRIEGGPGAGKLYGGNGNDTIFGDSSDDTITGDAGDDQIWGRDGNDSIRGGAGNDSLYGEGGTDLLRGDAGDDSLDGGLLADTLYGSAGNDTLTGGDGNDALFGDAGNDQVDGSAGDDSIRGGAGDDTLTGSAGNDHLFGDAGNDSLYLQDDATLYSDTADGGKGLDHVRKDDNDVVINIEDTALI